MNTLTALFSLLVSVSIASDQFDPLARMNSLHEKMLTNDRNYLRQHLEFKVQQRQDREAMIQALYQGNLAVNQKFDAEMERIKREAKARDEAQAKLDEEMIATAEAELDKLLGK